jgi:hypothetical protein
VGRDVTEVRGAEVTVDLWVIDNDLYWAPMGTRLEHVRLAAIPIPALPDA